MLDVDGAENIDFVIEQQKDVFIALWQAAAFDVGMSQLVDKSDLRSASQNGIDIHLGEESSFVIHITAGDLFEPFRQFSCPGAAVRFDDPDDYVFSTAVAANAFAEHAEGLADARGIAEEELEAAPLFLRRAGEKPVFGRFSSWIRRFGHAVRYTS